MPDTTEQAERLYCPVYRDTDGNEFIITHRNFVGQSHEDAFMIAMGSKLVECILTGMTYVRIAEVDPHNFPHQRARYGAYDVAVIAGPTFLPDASDAARGEGA